MQKILLQRSAALILLLASAVSLASDDEELARNILEKSDHIRFPRESFQVDVTIDTISPDQPVDIHKYRVLSKGNENSIVMTTEPASERGQILLMKGRDLWIFVPSVSQPVRLSLSQRLTGQVANGDLARQTLVVTIIPQFCEPILLTAKSTGYLNLMGWTGGHLS